MTSGLRFKFQGSKIRVSTGTSAAKTITAVTKANPAVVSSTAHGLTLGTVGNIAAVLGMTDLNGKLYVVDNPLTGTFELAGVDSTGYGTYTSGGTFTPLTYTDFCELTGFDQQDGTAGEIDATTICSTAKEFEVGLGDSGTATLNYNFAPSSGVQTAFRVAKKAGTQVAVQIVLPNSGGTVVLVGSVQQSSFSSSNDALWTGTTQMKLTGEIFVFAS